MSTPETPQPETEDPRKANPTLAQAPEGYKLYCPPLFVAVGANGHKLYSSNGIDWFDEAAFYSR
jgi:hypothetical protein